MKKKKSQQIDIINHEFTCLVHLCEYKTTKSKQNNQIFQRLIEKMSCLQFYRIREIKMNNIATFMLAMRLDQLCECKTTKPKQNNQICLDTI